LLFALFLTLPLHNEAVFQTSSAQEKVHRNVSGNMVYVKGGCFQMGDIFGNGSERERPVHEVCVDDFYMGKYEVTVGEFRAFVQDTGYQTEAEEQDGCHSWTDTYEKKKKEFIWHNTGFPQTDRHPVVCVTWNDANAYINWMNKKQRARYRLPTEAEWEYSARSGGKKYRFSWGKVGPSDNIADRTARRTLLRMMNVRGYDDGYAFTSPAGSFRPNELGLFDMSGNVYEWAADWFSADYYKTSPRRNPGGPENGSLKVLRGGSWNPLPAPVQTTGRRAQIPGGRGAWMGFRLAHPSGSASSRQ
jgi:formylglycine-generating enzyme required for sulfatase activity